MRINRILFFFSIVFWALLAQQLTAQNNFFFNLNAENDFPFNQIYHIIEDKDGAILICTESGVYKFDGLEYSKLYWENNNQDEILKFEQDEQKNTYGTGLKNRIYSIGNDSIKEIINWADSTLEYLYYTIDKGNLYLPSLGNRVNKLNLKTKKLTSTAIEGLTYSSGGALEFGAIIESIIYFKHKTLDKGLQLGSFNFKTKELKVFGRQLESFDGEYFKENNSLYFLLSEFKDNSDSLFKIDIKLNTLSELNILAKEPTNRFRGYSIENKIFITGSKGLEIYTEKAGLEAKFIADMHPTGIVVKNNTLWVSTLNDGLFLFPNLNATLLNSKNTALETTKLNRLLTDNKTILFTDKLGGLWQLNKKLKVERLETQSGKPHTTNYSYVNKEFYVGINSTMYAFRNGQSGIQREPTNTSFGNKAYDRIGKIEIAANTVGCIVRYDSIVHLNRYFSEKDIKEIDFQKKWKIGNLTSGRCQCSVINPKDSSIWFANSENLIKYTNKAKSLIRYKNESLFIRSIKFDKEFTPWFSSINSIYFYKNGTVEKLIWKENISPDLIINNFQIYSDTLLLSTNEGVYSYHLQTKKLKIWNNNDGLPTQNILNAAYFNSTLVAISNKGISLIPLSDDEEKYQPQLMLNKFEVNERAIEATAKNTFSYHENNVVISLKGIDLKSFKARIYNYRLLGAQTEWVQSSTAEDIRYPNLAPGIYEFEAFLESSKQIKSNTLQFSFKISPPFWTTWWFIGLLILFVAFIVYLVLNQRIKRIEKEKTLQNKLIQSEIDGLKSQMNPHFIFNALNSIQSLIIKQQVAESNLYLGKFADLLRSVLDYSNKEKITINEEVELLKIYLDLEKLRFKNKLNTEIVIEDKEAILNYKIPPLLLQPYVENSLKHGLLHSEREDKSLVITFSKKADYIICSIFDNGIGREASTAINQRREKYHKSFASDALEKRINLINATLNSPILIEIKDLKNGTCVEIRFPISYESHKS